MRLLHPATSPLQCDIYELSNGSASFILKDCSLRRFPIRTLARAILRHEWKIHAKIRDVPGVPRAVGWLDSNGLLIEKVNGIKISALKDRPIPLSFFEALERVVHAVHERGVAHGDISRSNVLIDEDNRPHLIDFATAFTRRTFLGRLVSRRVTRIDDLKVVRLKAMYHPEALSEAERRAVSRLPLELRIGQFLRKRVYRPIKPKRWKKRARQLKEANLRSKQPRS